MKAPRQDHRTVRVHVDHPALRVGRSLLSLGTAFVAVVALAGAHGGWAALYGVLWGLLAYGWGWLLAVLAGPVHEVTGTRNAVFVDGEEVADWTVDPRLGAPLVYAHESIRSFLAVPWRVAPDDPPEAIRVEGDIARRALTLRSWRFARVLRGAGWVWLSIVVALVVAPVRPYPLVPAMAAIAGMALFAALLTGALVLHYTGLDTEEVTLLLTPDALHVGTRTFPLVDTRFFRSEFEGGTTIYADRDGDVVALVRGDHDAMAWLARELNDARRGAHRRHGQGEREVPDALRALRGVSSRDA